MKDQGKPLTPPARPSVVVALAVVVLTLSCGCRRTGSARVEAAAASTVAPTDALVKTTEQGPVKATVRVWPTKPALDGQIFVQLEVSAEAGVAVSLPFQEAGVGRFTVDGYDRQVADEASGKSRQVQTYTLSAPSSGRHRIPPFRLEFIDSRTATAATAPAAAQAASGSGATPAAPAVATKEVLTEEIALVVAPVDANKSAGELQPAAGALDATLGAWPWWYYVAVGGLVTVWLTAGVLLLRRRFAQNALAKRVSAYDTATAQLARLAQLGAPEPAAADGWYVELSDIVRAYVEQRYEIAAPDLTTEEFLQRAKAASELSSEHRGLLSAFLAKCDEVKFAGYRPGAEESLAQLAAAQAFVTQTRLVVGDASPALRRAQGAM